MLILVDDFELQEYTSSDLYFDEDEAESGSSRIYDSSPLKSTADQHLKAGHTHEPSYEKMEIICDEELDFTTAIADGDLVGHSAEVSDSFEIHNLVTATVKRKLDSDEHDEDEHNHKTNESSETVVIRQLLSVCQRKVEASPPPVKRHMLPPGRKTANAKRKHVPVIGSPLRKALEKLSSSETDGEHLPTRDSKRSQRRVAEPTAKRVRLA